MTSIKNAAAEAGVTPNALRYYEKVGLLTIARDKNGIRQYSGHDLDRVRIICILRRMNMPIKDIRVSLDIGDDPTVSEQERFKQQLADLADSLDQKMVEIQQEKQLVLRKMRAVDAHINRTKTDESAV
ncbi:MerR family transcriptional regulator [Secundilactobacillus paracollinoides]|uniref:MerR family transcriptional regulator n=1 Tax=Secundilactobacillus paracollinoides TaxID=240427 RepID=UPI00177D8E72|nr:MerR family transcriptional regulator [Secundilactobacillus paracollinoides]